MNTIQKCTGGGRELKKQKDLISWGHQTGWSWTCLCSVRRYVLCTGVIAMVEDGFHFWIFDLHLEKWLHYASWGFLKSKVSDKCLFGNMILGSKEVKTEEGKPMQECLIQLATIKAADARSYKNPLRTLWKASQNHSSGEQKDKLFIFHFINPSLESGPTSCACVSEFPREPRPWGRKQGA